MSNIIVQAGVAFVVSVIAFSAVLYAIGLIY